MYELFYSPGTASLAVHWMLIHVDARFRLHLVDFKAQGQKSPDYLSLNPAGQTPTLIVDGRPVVESAAILMLLAERHGQAALAPVPGAPTRALYLQTMIYLANNLSPALRAWFYADEVAGPANSKAAMDGARGRIEAVMGRLDAQLSDGRTYLVGDDLSAADFLATMLMRWTRNMPKPATQWPHIARYLTTMRAMPSLRAVHAAEGLSDWIDD